MGEVKPVNQGALQPLSPSSGGKRPVPPRPVVPCGSGETAPNPPVGLADLQVKPAADPKKQFIETLMENKDIESADRELIIQLLNSDPLGREALIVKLANRYADLLISEIDGFDGKRTMDLEVYDIKSIAGKRIAALARAFRTALELSGVDKSNIEPLVTEATAYRALTKALGGSKNTLQNYLTDKDRQILSGYQLAKATQDNVQIRSKTEQLLWQLYDVRCQAKKAAPGTKEKELNYKRYRAFYLFVLKAGVKEEEIDRMFFAYMYTGFKGQELIERHQRYTYFYNAYASPEKVDDYNLRGKMLDEMRSVWTEYLGTDLQDTKRKSNLEGLWVQYAALAAKSGISIDVVFATRQAFQQSNIDKVMTFEELEKEVRSKHVLAISPRYLPLQIQEQLKSIPSPHPGYGTYWDLINGYCDVICLSDKDLGWVENKRTVGGFGGYTSGLSRGFWVDIKSLQSLDFTLTLIVHELEHIIWTFSNYEDPLMLNESVPTERNSFLRGARAANIILRKLIEENLPALKKIEETVKKGAKLTEEQLKLSARLYYLAAEMCYSRSRGRAANSVMGYNWDDEEYRACLNRALPSGENPDLETYPTNLSSNIASINQAIRMLGINGQEEQNIRSWYEKILSGKAQIRLNTTYDEKGRFVSVKSMVLIDNEGKEIMLEKGCKAAILKPLQQLYRLPVTGILDDKTMESLLMASREISDGLNKQEKIKKAGNSLKQVLDGMPKAKASQACSLVISFYTSMGTQTDFEYIKGMINSDLKDFIRARMKTDDPDVIEATCSMLKLIFGLELNLDMTAVLVRSWFSNDYFGKSELENILTSNEISDILRKAGYPFGS